MAQKLIRITTVPIAFRHLLHGQLKFMKEHGFEVLMISADGPEREKVMTDEACPHLIVPMTRKITPWQDLKCLIRLIKIFRKEKPDIVHTHTPKAGLLGMLAAKFCGIKIRIHTVAGLPLMVEKGVRYQLLKTIEKITYKAASQVWPNSHSLLEFIRQHRLTMPKKLQVIAKGSSNGIDLTRFSTKNLRPDILLEIREKIQYDEKCIYLLCIGRLVADKGIIELVNVFVRLQQHNPLLRLILVGDYEAHLDPLPQQILNEITSNKNIIHISWTSYVEYYMALANLFVFPSHREGFPNVLLQAGAMELPIVCSKIAGNVDIVVNNETGGIFTVNDENQLYEAIQLALKNSEKMRKMATQLLQIIQENYQHEKIWEAIVTQYHFLLK